MKIAIILNSLSSTGTNIATKDFVDELLKKQNIEITVFSLKSFKKGDLMFENVKFFSFFSIVKFQNFDVVYSSTLRSDFYVFLNKSIIRNNGKALFITTIHNIIVEDLYYDYGLIISTIFSKFWMFLKKNNHKVVVSSESMLKYYEKYFDKSKLSLIEYGRSKVGLPKYILPLSDSTQILKLKEKFKIVGTIGSLIKRKNYILVIDLLLKYDDLAWVCLGTGVDEMNLKEIVKENALQNRVLFLGNRPDSRPYYSFFDVFFHPSKSEGFALVLIDAMSNKTPILLATLPVYKSILKDDMVFYFNLNSKNSLFEQYEKLISDMKSTNLNVQKAFDVYENRFSIINYGEKYLKIFLN